MTHETLATLAAAAALAGLIAYALLGGADFGGGVWDLLATGPRRRRQRKLIAAAMGPVWEANHVWLIFVIVLLFTCFPRAYAALAVPLFVPFHVALAGIMLRGGAFVFRAHAAPKGEDGLPATTWGHIFGIASIISPLALGAAFGAVTAGGVEASSAAPAWLRPYALGCAFLALSTCAYLAAVYLVLETTDPHLREDFRRRAILAGTATAALAILVAALAAAEAPWFFRQLLAPRALPVVLAGLGFFALSAYAVFARRFRLARVSAAAQVTLILLGGGLAQHPFIAYPTHTLTTSAAPPATLRFMLGALPVGAALLIPSLVLLFRVFKSAPAGR